MDCLNKLINLLEDNRDLLIECKNTIDNIVNDYLFNNKENKQDFDNYFAVKEKISKILEGTRLKVY
jgi:hypothetical protein